MAAVIVVVEPSATVVPVFISCVGASSTGETVILNVLAGNVVVPSETVKLKLSVGASPPLWTYVTRLLLISAWVKLVMAMPGALVSSSCPPKGRPVTL